MNKGPLALRTISETADQVGVQQHVLRFWETKFPFIRPTKRAGGRRFYRPQDIDLLMGVKTLLYDRGYTIRGVQKLFKDEGQKAILSPGSVAKAPTDAEIYPPEDEGHSDGIADGESYAAPAELAGLQAGTLSREARDRFLDIARALEEAQQALGRHMGHPAGRPGGRGQSGGKIS